MELPYLKLIRKFKYIQVWQVDGEYVRDHINEEFTNFGHHGSIKEIPKSEIWLDREAKNDEQDYYIAHAVFERFLMLNKGYSYEKADTIADVFEKQFRSKEPKEDVHLEMAVELMNGVKVWIVNGKDVRDQYRVDFTEGGHDKVYDFIPEGEVWIDNDVEPEERPFILFHELHERNLMAKGKEYDPSHKQSSKLEHYYREHPDELPEALEKEGY